MWNIVLFFLSISCILWNTQANSCNGTFSQRIYFIGNSFTYYNSMPEEIYYNLMLASYPGVSIHVESNTQGGRGLYDPIPAVQKQALEQQTWDFVVLQDYSETPGLPDSNPNKATSMSVLATYYHPTIRDDSKAQAIMYDTWGYCCGDSAYPTLYPDFLSMNKDLYYGYLQYQDIMNDGEPKPSKPNDYHAFLSPVGMAFQQVYEDDLSKGLNPLTNGTFITLYVNLGTSYDKHPTQFGSYLIGCVHFALINGKSPIGIQYYPTIKPTDGPYMTPSQRDYAQNVAHRVVIQNSQQIPFTLPKSPADLCV